ncbi:uncharacterized protein LOC131163060 isoform X2 [Malania oleifera]|uniref:uncharacterized protein LOC131163060 isoform X2 n=1 Tax=Malania oleifera TaxID=397392 RepID=UPI0025AE62FD|nr:uncharacterized protein LOC131163060 isoform X2 [Malania oleifera]
MAEEEVVAPAAAASPAPLDHKRKLEDVVVESQAPHPSLDLNVDSEPAAAENAEGDDKDTEASEAKRPRIEDKPDGLVSENGHQAEKEDETLEGEAEEEQPTVDNAVIEDAEDLSKEAPEVIKNEQVDAGSHEMDDTLELPADNPQLGDGDQVTEGEPREPSSEIPQSVDVYSEQQQPTSENQTTSRKMEVPNNKVGVLIGKAGDTIRYLQYNSGVKIQITRDADADPYSATRPVELIGTLENINKAEKLIKDVIAEADAGGSPSLVARGFAAAQGSGAGEQIQIQVPNEKVGLIIGKGGETIKNLQTRSGARIQLIPQHLPEGDQSKERTVRVTGDRKQIEMAREMIKEVMNQPVRQSHSGGYNQQAFRPRGPSGPPQWGPRPHHAQAGPYDYQHRGPHASQNLQYPQPAYGSYPPQQGAPRSSFGSGWEQRPPATMQGPPHSSGYDYYGGPGGGHSAGTPSSNFPAHVSGPPASAMGTANSQANYNYGQPHGTDYGQPVPYSQTVQQQSYGHGYEEPKYDNQAPAHLYGAHGSSQPGYPQAGTQPGYASQQQYGRPPSSYGMHSQGLAQPQSFGPPRASQPGDVPYQGPSPSQSYGSNVPPQQQPYPYSSSGPMQQNYPAYGSAPATDGYHQPLPASGQGYPQQGTQPVSGYSQQGGQPGYAQAAAQGVYGSYSSTQAGYTEQLATNSAGYGYQGPADSGYNNSGGPTAAYSAPVSGQQGYAQSVPAQQPTYDQSIPQSGDYGGLASNAPVGYGKSSPPQPGYSQHDSAQMYGAQHR